MFKIKSISFCYVSFFALFLSYTVCQTAFANHDPIAKYDAVLKRHVSIDGLVDYAGLKKDNDFEAVVEYFANTDPAALLTGNERLAFWVNAYNVFVLKGVLNAYPVESVLDIGLIPHSFFRVRRFRTKQGKMTLSTIENKKIRDSFNEPRIHFAINCASMGCPILLNVPYRAETLEQQLEKRAVSFINNKRKNYLDKVNGILYLSRIFKWYEGDFVNGGALLKGYVFRYLNPEDAEYIRVNKIKIEFNEYDWQLNAIETEKEYK